MNKPPSQYAFEKDINRQLGLLSTAAPTGLQKWGIGQLFVAAFIVLVFIWLALEMPNRFWEPDVKHISVALGALGIWRFSWWFTHYARAEFYQNIKWPRLRSNAQTVWQSGWRPNRLHIQMVTFQEEPAITRRVIGSILDQIRREKIPTTIYVGTGTSDDERIIRAYIETHATDIDDDLAKLVFIRQNQPGKRMAIGLILRAMSRAGVDPDDLIIFMDGDTVYGHDVMKQTLPLFGADPTLQALTTNEEVICYGPAWMQSLLNLRFAQRRLTMQSHSMSDKVLTLTGRMSIFRAKHVLSEKFIRNVEADHLNHWLWGRFRFLSGDDKSTWYHMLTCDAKMLYVPDATVYTIEVIKGSGTNRMIQNFRRWSGNMLRNGTRAIALGPRKVNPFIWWCLIDQRIAIWTMLVSPVLAILATAIEPTYIWSCLLWIAATRFFLCLCLFRYSRSIDLSWPIALYLNQLTNALVKVFMLFNLNKQSWSNRGNQKANLRTDHVAIAQNTMSKVQLATAILGFITLLSLYAGVLPNPL